jgi:hypothetical protein
MTTLFTPEASPTVHDDFRMERGYNERAGFREETPCTPTRATPHGGRSLPTSNTHVYTSRDIRISDIPRSQDATKESNEGGSADLMTQRSLSTDMHPKPAVKTAFPTPRKSVSQIAAEIESLARGVQDQLHGSPQLASCANGLRHLPRSNGSKDLHAA